MQGTIGTTRTTILTRTILFPTIAIPHPRPESRLQTHLFIYTSTKRNTQEKSHWPTSGKMHTTCTYSLDTSHQQDQSKSRKVFCKLFPFIIHILRISLFYTYEHSIAPILLLLSIQCNPRRQAKSYRTFSDQSF